MGEIRRRRGATESILGARKRLEVARQNRQIDGDDFIKNLEVKASYKNIADARVFGGLSTISAISDQLGYSRNTVSKALNDPEVQAYIAYNYDKLSNAGIHLQEFTDELDAMLAEDLSVILQLSTSVKPDFSLLPLRVRRMIKGVKAKHTKEGEFICWEFLLMDKDKIATLSAKCKTVMYADHKEERKIIEVDQYNKESDQ